ncbi:tyrosine-type recombinase/integrase [Pseudomonas sp. KB-10]|uniref:tyrosine-type recombinase/integrase n=1 Tax=Pseudomonas sp. KB-10 TaxID=2292264 RepID=UPI001BAF026D|nr:tyrosine-type recombinase/integrase [Pseudomonas sp. KB-10]
MGTKKILVRGCVYAVNPLNGKPLHCDTYIIQDRDAKYYWHENLFLCEVAKCKSLNTVRSYASDLVMFCEMSNPLGGWQNITSTIMRGYINGAMFSTRRYSEKTLARHLTTIKQFYSWLYEKGYLDAPTNLDFSYKDIFITDRSADQAYAIAQHTFNASYISHLKFKKILTGIQSRSAFIVSRNEIILRLGFETGTRASEVLQLDYPLVRKAINRSRDENNGLWAATTVPLIGKGNVRRDLIIPPNLCETIMRYINTYRSKISSKGPIFCTRAGKGIKDTKFASSIFTTACKKALIMRSCHQGYHALRKSFGTHLVDECYKHGRDPWVEVPRRLGHKNVDTTLKYIHFDALLNKRSKILSELNMRRQKFRGLQ